MNLNHQEQTALVRTFLKANGIEMEEKFLTLKKTRIVYKGADFDQHLNTMIIALNFATEKNERFPVTMVRTDKTVEVKIQNSVVLTYSRGWFSNVWICNREIEQRTFLPKATFSDVFSDAFDFVAGAALAAVTR